LRALELPTLSRAAVRELDRRAIEEHGVPSIVLMENAGRGCAFEAVRMLDDWLNVVGSIP
jgi:NAD(P)H-hydrate epimerase